MIIRKGQKDDMPAVLDLIKELAILASLKQIMEQMRKKQSVRPIFIVGI